MGSYNIHTDVILNSYIFCVLFLYCEYIDASANELHSARKLIEQLHTALQWDNKLFRYFRIHRKYENQVF